MQPKELIAWLQHWERELPVAEWTVRGIHVWPYLRIAIATGLWKSAETEKHAAPTPPKRQRFARAKLVFDLRKVVSAHLQDGAHSASTADRADVVFLVNPADRTKLHGSYYHVYADPLADHLEQRGLRTLALEFASFPATYRLPRHRASVLMQPRQLLTDVRVQLGRFTRSQHQTTQLAGYTTLQRAAAELGEAQVVPSLATLTRQAAWIDALSRSLGRILERTKPRVVMSVCYFGAHGMALNLAARRAGIVSVDLQHGVFVNHIAYDSWTAVPDDGYELLPDVFWCWTKRDAAVIDSWSERSQRRHRSLVGGQPWTCLFHDRESRIASEARARVEQLRAATSAERIVLLTLQWDQGFTPLMKALIKEAPAGWHFWIRLHPAMSQERPEIRRWIEEHAPGRCSVDEPSDLPLPVLLQRTDIHCTRYSTVVQEAAAAAVPSLVLDRFALDLYGAEVAAGWVELGETAATGIAAIEKLSAAREQRQPMDSLGSEESMQSALQALLTRNLPGH